ncbi:MAG TPA: hypothetical protein VH558_15980 [Pseudolabrys sp.]|jgi:hypothetical protein
MHQQASQLWPEVQFPSTPQTSGQLRDTNQTGLCDVDERVWNKGDSLRKSPENNATVVDGWEAELRWLLDQYLSAGGQHVNRRA